MRAAIFGAAVLVVAGCDVSRTVDRSGLSSFKVSVVCSGEYSTDCPAIPDGGVAQCPASPVAPMLGTPIAPVDRTQGFYLVQVTAFDGNGNVKTDYSGTENVYIQFEGSVTPTRGAGIPPLTTVNVVNGSGCFALTMPPAFNQTNIWVEEPTTFVVDAGHRWPQGSFTVGSSDTIFRPAPLISDVAYTSDPVQETSPLNNKHVIIDQGNQGRPIVVTYVSANYFTVTDLGQYNVQLPDYAWGSLELYTYSQPYGVKVGSVVSHLNGSVQNFLGLPELNFPVWTVERYEPDPVLAPLPAPHRLHYTDIMNTIQKMAPYKSGLVEIVSDDPANPEQWLICGLNGPALTSYYKYSEWIITTKQHTSCGDYRWSFDVVTNAGVPDFDPLKNIGKKICKMTGLLTVVVPAAGVNLWTITPRNTDDFPVDGNIVDVTTPCPPLNSFGEPLPMSRIRAALLLTALYAPLANAGDFLDARFSMNLTDENLLVKPGETVPSIPGVRFASPIPRWGLFFYENYDTRLTGFENFTNLVLYKNISFGQEDFEGAMVVRFTLTPGTGDVLAGLSDGGSYAKWTHWFDPTRQSNTNISVTAFPFSSDLFRLGYSYRISWGGSPIMFSKTPDNPQGSNANAVPALRLQFASEKAYVFVGAKTSLLLNQADNQQEPIYGFLAGAGYDVFSFLRVEANAGYFYRGVNPIQAVLGTPVVTYGASAQAVLHSGVPVGRSGDFATYRNDPTTAARYVQPEEYPGGLSWAVSAEGTFTQTTLAQDPDPTRSQSTTRQTGLAGDINARIKWNHWRLHADLSYMDTAYLLLNVPSFVPFQALSPTLSTTTPQIFGAAGIDYFFEKARLTLGVTAGVQLPSTFQGKLPPSFSNDLPPDALPLSTTVVVRQDGIYDVLPANSPAQPIFGGKATATLGFMYFNVVLDVLGGYDYNITHLARINNDPQQVATRVFNNPWQLGFNLALQARL